MNTVEPSPHHPPQALPLPAAAPSPVVEQLQARSRVGPLLLRLGLGVLLSTALIWAVGAFFLNSVTVWEWDEAVGRWLPRPGQQTRWTQEGWATTTFGDHGLVGQPPGQPLRPPLVVFWGDSYVEAEQVADRDKMTARFGALQSLQAVGLGLSGWSLSDPFFLIPRYEKLLPAVRAHVILIQMSDVLPDGETLLEGDPGVFRERRWSPTVPALRPWFYRFHLSFLWELLRDVPRALRQMRFSPGPVAESGEAEDAEEGGIPETSGWHGPVPRQTWDRALQLLRGQTEAPLYLVYVPYLPRLSEGRIVDTDPDAPLVPVLAELCREHGVGFLDLSEQLREYTRRTGSFPRGFPNSRRPGHGHFNEAGHELVARAVAEALDGGEHAVP